MKVLLILLTAGLLAAVLVLLVSYICFRMAFYADRRKAPPGDIPEGPVYEPYRAVIENFLKETRTLPYRDVSIRSFDGLTLTGKFYEYAPGAPIELMFHGYRGTAQRDLSGGIQRCFALGRSALIVDQRTSGGSGGNVITFGVNESRDCHSWLDFMLEEFGPDIKIILTGISMGAATVMMAAAQPLPKNVAGVLADCGYTSAKEIIQEVIRQMKLPPKLCWPFVKLGARLFGHFDIEELPPIEAVRQCSVPVIFFHGESDDYVPCRMSQRNFEACAAPRKRLVTIPGADHGLSYLVEPERYLDELRSFFPEETRVK